jgi:hypothetical protein
MSNRPLGGEKPKDGDASTSPPPQTARRSRRSSRPTTTSSTSTSSSSSSSGSSSRSRSPGGRRNKDSSSTLSSSPTRGLSSLISKSSRFPANLLNTEAAYTPPPTAYNPPAAGGVYGIRGDLVRSRDGHAPTLRPSGVFLSRSDRHANSFAPRDSNSENPLVGPGSYNPPARGAGPQSLECVRPFKSITPRFVRIVNY